MSTSYLAKKREQYEGKKNSSFPSSNSKQTSRISSIRKMHSTIGEEEAKARDILVSTYNGWQDESTMIKNRKTVENMYNNLNRYKEFKQTNDFDDVIGAYKNALDNWDSIKDYYGKFKNADAYNTEVKKSQYYKDNPNLSYLDVRAKMSQTDENSDEYGYLKEYGMNAGFNSASDYDAMLGYLRDNGERDLYDKTNAKKNQYELTHKFDKYSPLMQNSDFEKEAIFPEGLADFYVNGGKYGETYNAMTDDEINVGYYIYNTQGEDAYWDYMKDMSKSVGYRDFNEDAEDLQKWLQGHPGREALFTIGSYLGNVLSYPGVAIQQLASTIEGEDYNPYTSFGGFQNRLQSGRSAISADIASATDFELPIIGNVGAAIYDVTNSTIDSALGGFLYGHGFAPLMGTSAFNSTYKEAIENGLNPENAVMTSVLSGLAETTFEYVSLEHWLKIKDAKNAKQFFINLIGQSIAEGSEEFNTEIANKLSDIWVNGNASDYARRADELKKYGYSDSEIKKMINSEYVKDILKAGIEGSLSGALMGGVQTALQTEMAREQGVNVDYEALKKTINDAEFGEELKSLEEKYPNRNGLNYYTELGTIYSKALEKTGQTLNEKETNEERSQAFKDYINLLKAQKSDAQIKAEKQTRKYTAEKTSYNGKEVALLGMTEDGKVKTSEGDVDIKDLDLSSKDATVVVMASDMSDKMKADAFVANYKGQNLTEYESNFNLAFVDGRMEGKEGITVNQMLEDIDTSVIGPMEATKIFESGKASVNVASAKVDTVGNEILNKYRNVAKRGKFDVTAIEGMELTSTEKAILRIAEAFSLMGVNVRVIKNIDAISINGKFDRGNNEVIINLAARYSANGDIFDRRYVLPTMAHEFTHWMEKKAAPEFKQLQDLIFGFYGEKKTELLIAQEQKRFEEKHEGKLSRADAISEVMARACEDMLSDGKVLEDILSRASRSTLESLKAKVMEFFENMKAFLKDLMDGYASFSEAARYLRSNQKVFEQAQKLWANAFDKALQFSEAVEESTEQTEDVRATKSFNLKETIELNENSLMAYHNLSEENLLKSIELGGFALPSIAIKRAVLGHTDYGDISVIFPKSVIDPKRSSKNAIYSGDAWTPTFPSVDYKVSESKQREIEAKVKSLVGDAYGILGSSRLSLADMQDAADRGYKGEEQLIKSSLDNNVMKYAFLADKGEAFDIPMTAQKYSSEFSNEQLGAMALVLGDDILSEINKDVSGFYRNNPEVVDRIRLMLNESYLKNMELSHPGNEKISKLFANRFGKDGELSFADFDKFTRAMRQVRQGEKKIVDTVAFKEKLSDINEAEYKEWLTNLFNGIIEKNGIRNNLDWYTPSGNRRSWDALHWELTLENVVKAMLKEEQQGSVGFFDAQNIWGVATKKYSSIDAMKKEIGRLVLNNEEERKALRTAYTERLIEISRSIMNTNRDSMFAMDEAASAVVDSLRGAKTVESIDKRLRDYSDSLHITDHTAQDVLDLYNDILKMPTGYFEAKPQRAVGLSEIAYVVIPSDSSSKLIKALDDNGIAHYEYARNDLDFADRINVTNEAAKGNADVLFNSKTYGNLYSEGDDFSSILTEEDYARIDQVIKTNPGELLPSGERAFILDNMLLYNKRKKLTRVVKAFSTVDVKNNEHTVVSFVLEDLLDYEKDRDFEGLGFNAVAQAEQNYAQEEFGGEISIYADYGQDSITDARLGMGRESKIRRPINYHFGDEQDGEGDSSESFGNSSLNSDKVTDSDLLDFLNGQIERGEYVTTYKSMRLDDGQLHSPMAALINGKYENEYELGSWYQAVEHPELVKIDKKNGQPYFNLQKGKDEEGKDLGTVPARYNPYEHSSNYVINDQFKTAYKRDNLVTVEMRIPMSELTSGYKAQYAKDAVGWQEWKKGDVATALAKKGMERKVLLSRYAMPYRIVPNSEVSAKYKELLEGTNIKVPNNVVTPSLLSELKKIGVPIDENGISKFEGLYSDKVDSEGNALSEQQIEFFKDSKVRDENGRLKIMYHGTQSAGFTVFDRDFSDDGLSFFFTDDLKVARGYSGSSEMKLPKSIKTVEEFNEYANKLSEETYDYYTKYEFEIEKNGDKYDLFVIWKKNNGYELVERSRERFVVSSYDEAAQLLDTEYGNNDGQANYGVYLNLVNPFILDADNNQWDEIPFNNENATTREIALYANNNGYDGVIIENLFDNGGMSNYQGSSTVVIAFNSNQIKSVANTNPTSDADIRYSDKVDSDVADLLGKTKKIEAENKRLKADVERLNKVLKLNRTVTKGMVLKDSQLDVVARVLLKDANSKMDKAELISGLKEVYGYILENSSTEGKEVNWDVLMGKAFEVARKLMAESKPDVIEDAYYKGILKDIRQSRVRLDEQQIAEAKNWYGERYRDAFMGKVILVKDGISLDSQWQEWATMYPDIFDADMNSADMPGALLDIYDDVKEMSETLQYYNDYESIKAMAVEIYEKFWNVDTVNTMADKHKAEVLKLKADHRQAMTELKAKADEQTLADKMYYNKLLKKLRDKNEAEKAELKEYMKKKNAERKDAILRKAQIEKITDTALTLGKWLTANSVKEHIPTTLQAPVKALISAIDFSSKQLLGMRGGENAFTPTKKDISISKALEKVRDVVTNAEKAQTDSGVAEGLDTYIDFPPQYAEDINKISQAVNEIERRIHKDNAYILNEMSLEDLKSLAEAVTVMKHCVTGLNKLISTTNAHSVDYFAQGTIQEASEHAQRKKEVSKIRKYGQRFLDFIDFQNGVPYYVTKRLGPSAHNMFKLLVNGHDKFAFNIKEVVDFAEGCYTTEEANKWLNEVNEFDILEVASDAEKAEGQENRERHITMTTAQIMSLYCLSKREQAKGHIFGGGIVINGYDTKFKHVAAQKGVTLTDSELEKILKVVTENPRVKEVADNLQLFMNTVCQTWGNEVSMKRFGIEAFTEENYFPIASDSNVTNAEPRDSMKSIYALLNMSFTKSLVKNANNRIVIDDIFNTFTIHAGDMAKYNAIALPVLDYVKWFNYKEKVERGDAFETITVKGALDDAFGAEASKYIRHLLYDLNGQAEMGRGESTLKKFTKGYKIAAVGANLQVALLQPTSYLRATYVMDEKYLLKALTRKPSIAKCKEHCGLALWKSFGFYNTDVSRGLDAMIKHSDTIKDKLVEKSNFLAEKADEITWGTLWNACEAEIMDKNPSLAYNSEEFNKAVADRLTDVILATQVVDSTLTRSDLMRSTSMAIQAVTAFQSEPTLSLNMLNDARTEFTDELAKSKNLSKALTKSGKKIAKASEAYILASFLESCLRAGMSKLRNPSDDEDDEYIKLVISNVIQEINVARKIPIVKEAFEYLEGYSSTRMDMAAIESTVGIYKEFQKILTTDKEWSYKTTYKLITAISQASGLPLSNALREIATVWNNTIGLMYPDIRLLK